MRILTLLFLLTGCASQRQAYRECRNNLNTAYSRLGDERSARLGHVRDLEEKLGACLAQKQEVEDLVNNLK